LLAARIALASGGIKALMDGLPNLEVASAELKALVAAAEEAGEGDADGKAAPLEPSWAYVKGMQARLAGKPALAADLLAKALAGHGDACRAAGEYLAACEAVGRVPDANAFGWLLGNNAQCVNLPAAFAAAEEKREENRGRRPASRAAHGSR
jgi:hypothetical protein